MHACMEMDATPAHYQLDSGPSSYLSGPMDGYDVVWLVCVCIVRSVDVLMSPNTEYKSIYLGRSKKESSQSADETKQ